MKRFFCRSICIVFIISSIIINPQITYSVYAQNNTVSEEKILCTATVEEEFAENRVYMEIEL